MEIARIVANPDTVIVLKHSNDSKYNHIIEHQNNIGIPFCTYRFMTNRIDAMERLFDTVKNYVEE